MFLVLKLSETMDFHVANDSSGNELFNFLADSNGKFYRLNVSHRELQSPTVYKTADSIEFLLVTRNYPNEMRPIVIGDVQSLCSSNFNPEHPTKILVHGWIANRSSPINHILPQSYHQRGEYNIVVMDWGDIAWNYDYITVRRSIGKVGRQLAKFIDFLYSYGGAHPSGLYLIGHSLGAHICGIAAKHVRSGRVGVIIALDAAGPLFSTYHQDRLTKSVAEYVQSIHTSSMGIFEPIGHASFYPNGGKDQPGCKTGFGGMGCSHNKVLNIFGETLTGELVNFMSRRCGSLRDLNSRKCLSNEEGAYMGGDPANTQCWGIFYLKTKDPLEGST